MRPHHRSWARRHHNPCHRSRSSQQMLACDLHKRCGPAASVRGRGCHSKNLPVGMPRLLQQRSDVAKLRRHHESTTNKPAGDRKVPNRGDAVFRKGARGQDAVVAFCIVVGRRAMPVRSKLPYLRVHGGRLSPCDGQIPSWGLRGLQKRALPSQRCLRGRKQLFGVRRHGERARKLWQTVRANPDNRCPCNWTMHRQDVGRQPGCGVQVRRGLPQLHVYCFSIRQRRAVLLVQERQVSFGRRMRGSRQVRCCRARSNRAR